MDSYKPVDKSMSGMVQQIYTDSSHKSGDFNERANKKLAAIQEAGGQIDEIRHKVEVAGSDMRFGIVVFYRVYKTE